MDNEFGKDGFMKWQRVSPPVMWPAAQTVIVADRHLPDGTRQHMVPGRIPAGRVVANAQVVGEDDSPGAEFSAALSHMSGAPLSPLFHKLTMAQRRVLGWIGKGWRTEPGAGSAVLVNGKRICNCDTMMTLHRLGLARKDDLGSWSATSAGKAVASQFKL